MRNSPATPGIAHVLPASDAGWRHGCKQDACDPGKLAPGTSCCGTVTGKQCNTELMLVHDSRIKGIVFLAINNARGVVHWTANWIEEVGD